MSGWNMSPLAQWNVGSDVNSIAISHDGSRVASGSDGRCVHVWDVHTGALILGPLKGHTGIVRSVAFSHDSTRIVSASSDTTIRIWDTRTSTPMGEPLKGHASTVHSVAFSHDSTRIVSGSSDSTIRIWDSRTGTPVSELLKGHTKAVYSVAFSHDSTLIVSGSVDKTIRIWNARADTPMGEPLKGHTGAVYSVAFLHDSTRIVSGSYDNTIRIWDVHTGSPVGEPLKGHTDSVWSAAFSQDGTRIVSASRDSTIRIWDACTGVSIGEPLKGHNSRVSSVAFLPDSTKILSGSYDGTIAVWQAPQNIPSPDMFSLQNTLSLDMVTSKMSAQDMFACLVKDGCADLSSSVDPTLYSSPAVASGGVSDVWRARIQSGIQVAVKRLRLDMILEGDEKCTKNISQQLLNWSKARHDNIQELLGVTMLNGQLGMVSLWMENGTLYQYIRKNPAVDRYALCVQVATGVSYLHSIGIVHGDIKSPNVLVSADGIAKIKDFDYSVLTEKIMHFLESTKIGGGTLRWMAPELLEPQAEDGPRVTRNKLTDVYALGMTMLEIVTGQVPYYEFSFQMAIYGAIFRKQLPRRPKELPEKNEKTNRMWQLLVKCWDHEPSGRPNSSDIAPVMRVFVL